MAKRGAIGASGESGNCWIALYTAEKCPDITHIALLSSNDTGSIKKTHSWEVMPRAAWRIDQGLESPVLGKIELSLRARFGETKSKRVVSHFRSGVKLLGSPHDRPLKAWTYGVAPDQAAARISELIGNPPQIGTAPAAKVSAPPTSAKAPSRIESDVAADPAALVDPDIKGPGSVETDTGKMGSLSINILQRSPLPKTGYTSL